MRDGWGGQQRDFAAVVRESCKPRSRRTVILLKKKNTVDVFTQITIV